MYDFYTILSKNHENGVFSLTYSTTYTIKWTNIISEDLIYI